MIDKEKLLLIQSMSKSSDDDCTIHERYFGQFAAWSFFQNHCSVKISCRDTQTNLLRDWHYSSTTKMTSAQCRRVSEEFIAQKKKEWSQRNEKE